MSGPFEDGSSGKSGDNGIHYREIPVDPDDADYNIVSLVAELEGGDFDDLPSFYPEIDHFAEKLLRNPPSARAQMEIEFSYAGYRVRMDSRGQVRLWKQ